MTPEAAEQWLAHMKATMAEMELETPVKELLLRKIQALARNMAGAGEAGANN